MGGMSVTMTGNMESSCGHVFLVSHRNKTPHWRFWMVSWSWGDGEQTHPPHTPNYLPQQSLRQNPQRQLQHHIKPIIQHSGGRSRRNRSSRSPSATQWIWRHPGLHEMGFPTGSRLNPPLPPASPGKTLLASYALYDMTYTRYYSSIKLMPHRANQGHRS